MPLLIEGLLLHIQTLAETKLMSPLLIGELTDMTLSAKHIFHVWLWGAKEPVPAAVLSKQGEVLGTAAQVHAPRSREQPASLHGGWMWREVPGCTPKTRAPLRAKLMTPPVSFPERCLRRLEQKALGWRGGFSPKALLRTREETMPRESRPGLSHQARGVMDRGVDFCGTTPVN